MCGGGGSVRGGGQSALIVSSLAQLIADNSVFKEPWWNV